MKVAVLVLAAAWLSGCGFSGSKSQTWPEYVDPGSGESILVDRKVEQTTESIEARSSISFRDALADIPAWNEPLIPLLLYPDPATREWTIVATTPACGREPYREFRLHENHWRRVGLSESSIGRESNLYVEGFGEFPKAPITLAAKGEARYRTGIPDRYRTISRNVTGSCT